MDVVSYKNSNKREMRTRKLFGRYTFDTHIKCMCKRTRLRIHARVCVCLCFLCIAEGWCEHNVLCEAKQSHAKREINLHFSDVWTFLFCCFFFLSAALRHSSSFFVLCLVRGHNHLIEIKRGKKKLNEKMCVWKIWKLTLVTLANLL